MKYLLAIVAIIFLSSVATQAQWKPCEVTKVSNEKTVGMYCPGFRPSPKARVVLEKLAEINPVMGEQFYLLDGGRCLIPFTKEDQDRERFIRQPSNFDCESGELFSVLSIKENRRKANGRTRTQKGSR